MLLSFLVLCLGLSYSCTHKKCPGFLEYSYSGMLPNPSIERTTPADYLPNGRHSCRSLGFNAAMAYCFRVCFCEVGEGGITSDAESIEFVLKVTGLTLKFSSGSKGVAIGKNERFHISGGSFATADEAFLAAQQVWTALLRRSVVMRRGLDLGQHSLKSFGISEYGKQFIAARLKVDRVEPDHLGITIYSDDPKPTFVRMNAKGVVSSTAQSWVDDLAESVGRYSFNSASSDTATGIYAISHFVGRPVARFLLLFVSLEALFEPTLRSQKARAHIDCLIATTQASDLPEDERAAISSQLTFLRQASIAQTGQVIAKTRLIGKKYLDKDPEAFFQYAYRVRNGIVHSAVIDPTALQNLLGEMDRFVSDILATEYVEL